MQDGEVDLDPCEWSVLSVKEIEHMKYYSCCSEPYYNIEVMITVQRRSPANASVFFTVAFGNMNTAHSTLFIQINYCALLFEIFNSLASKVIGISLFKRNINVELWDTILY